MLMANVGDSRDVKDIKDKTNDIQASLTSTYDLSQGCWLHPKTT